MKYIIITKSSYPQAKKSKSARLLDFIRIFVNKEPSTLNKQHETQGDVSCYLSFA